MLVVALAVASCVACVASHTSGRATSAASKAESEHRRLEDLTPPSQSAELAQRALEFAEQAAVSLRTYDSRVPQDRWRRELLARLGTADGSPGSQDIERMIPDVAQWAQMAAIGQRSSQTITDAYIPPLWTRTTREHPELPDGAVGVTVIGTQLVAWEGGRSRVPVAVTLLVLCSSTTKRCVVSRITAQVAR
jgi:hypothetical protein